MVQVTTKIQGTNSILQALKCKECGTEYELKATHVCESCFGPLEVKYDYNILRQNVSRAKIQAGPQFYLALPSIFYLLLLIM